MLLAVLLTETRVSNISPFQLRLGSILAVKLNQPETMRLSVCICTTSEPRGCFHTEKWIHAQTQLLTLSTVAAYQVRNMSN